MDRQAWCYVCGLTSALEVRLLGRRDILALAEPASDEELRSQLRASILFADAPPPGELTDAIYEAYRDFVRGVAAVSPCPRIGDLFLAERDWRAFREYAKDRVTENALEPAGPGPEKGEKAALFDAVWRGDVEDEGLRAFAEAAAFVQDACPAEGDRAGWIDLCLDARETAALRADADTLGSPVLSEWVRIWTNLLGALAILRAAKTGAKPEDVLAHWQDAGFEDPDLKALSRAPESEWEALLDRLGLPHADRALNEAEPTVRLAKSIDTRVAELVSAGGGEPFGPERVFAFLWAVSMEATDLRQALTASEYGIPEERVAAELRATRA